RPGDRIDVGPYALFFDGQSLSSRSRVNNVELVCRNLRRVVKDRTSGRPLTLLDDITLVVRPKEFVCVLGPSGSGKSTLLWALSAREPADQGTVTINGEHFYGNFDALKHDVAVVPQNVVLHDLLAVRTALRYTARLRLPCDTNDAETEAAVIEILSTVGLAERQNTKIRDLSGGQVKRVSLANEIISKPNVLFLDEVTSGLDEETDREMMKLFREIADTGKTVICITHTSVNIEQNCDLVVILAPGGKLAFFGSPAEALRYFGIRRLGDVYEKLSEREPEQWKRSFLQHNVYSQYVDRRLPADDDADTPPVPRISPPLAQRVQLLLRQGRILTSRYLKLQIADIRSLATMLGQCVLVALLLVVLYGDLEEVDVAEKATYSGNIIFLLAISCLWFGCNNAAKEIVKERIIYLRERDVNVMVPSYYASKLLLLGVICLIQATVLLGIVRYFTNLPGGFSSQWVFLVMLALTGVAMGLLISAVSKTNDNAVGMVPAALLPQIILAGVIAPVEGAAKWLAQLLISAYWGYRGLATLLPEDICKMLGGEDWSTAGAFCALALHFGVFVAAAVGVLMFGDPSARASTAKALANWLARARARLD
ncbi:MAG: ATP-binding cassette domain-containing protein, partial [Planctomycetota bacterium]